MKANVVIDLSDLSAKALDNIQTLFSLEDKIFSGDRSSYKLENKDGNLVISVYAADAVALRSCMTAIVKTLSIYERTGSIANSSKV